MTMAGCRIAIDVLQTTLIAQMCDIEGGKSDYV